MHAHKDETAPAMDASRRPRQQFLYPIAAKFTEGRGPSQRQSPVPGYNIFENKAFAKLSRTPAFGTQTVHKGKADGLVL
jgi:hypothetical protein